MANYSLSLTITQADLNIIKGAGQRITLAKPVSSGDPNVVWLSIDPFQNTTVEWKEEYWIYASTSEITQGTQIAKISEVSPGPAQDAGYYTFTSAATFTPFTKETNIAEGTYVANNEMPFSQYPVLTFGLSQSALVSKKPVERKPISAQSVLSRQKMEATPFTNVHVWLQSQFASETIITRIVGNSTVAKFGGGVNEISLAYDANKGVFVPAAESAKLHDKGLILLRTPLVI